MSDIPKQATSHFLKEPNVQTLAWAAPWKSLEVGAIVVNHVVLLHPSESSSSIRVQPLGLPSTIRLSSCELWSTGRWAYRPVAGVGAFEVPKVRSERSLRPIRFHKPATRRPLVCVPEARVKLHGLALRERNPDGFIVVEYSKRDVIHQETAKEKISYKVKFVMLKWIINNIV